MFSPSVVEAFFRLRPICLHGRDTGIFLSLFNVRSRQNIPIPCCQHLGSSTSGASEQDSYRNYQGSLSGSVAATSSGSPIPLPYTVILPPKMDDIPMFRSQNGPSRGLLPYRELGRLDVNGGGSTESDPSRSTAGSSGYDSAVATKRLYAAHSKEKTAAASDAANEPLLGRNRAHTNASMTPSKFGKFMGANPSMHLLQMFWFFQVRGFIKRCNLQKTPKALLIGHRRWFSRQKRNEFRPIIWGPWKVPQPKSAALVSPFRLPTSIRVHTACLPMGTWFVADVTHGL